MANFPIKWLMLCREPRLYSCQRIKTECEQRGILLDILDPNRMLLKLVNVGRKSTARLFYQTPEQELALGEYQAVLPRFGATSTEMGCYVLQHFEINKTKVLIMPKLSDWLETNGKVCNCSQLMVCLFPQQVTLAN